eukprot:TRINITY_DN14977_c0_g1_i1.p1 TRINITY_DN14977_c0_g1~~TRINITY_DN14977_c0_g1_i1.p1  ORF type:complete len:1892 (+),score=220.42 TRINITY_DN14977_c0_g1_i1:68-5743(+)
MITRLQPRRSLPWSMLLILASLLSIFHLTKGDSTYLDAGESFPKHPGLQEVTLFRVSPQSSFALSIIQDFPPRLVKINLRSLNDSSTVETLLEFSNGSYAVSEGTWAAGYLYFTVFDAQSRRTNLYRTNGFVNGTGPLGESFAFITSAYATSTHVFYYLFISSNSSIQVVREPLPGPTAPFGYQARELHYSFNATGLPTARASIPAAVVQDRFYFIPPAPAGAQEIWVSMPNQSVSTQFTFGSASTTDDDPMQLVSLMNSTVLMWTTGSGRLYRCCPSQIETAAPTLNSTLLEKLSESEILIDANPFSIFDTSTNSFTPISYQKWRSGSVQRSGSRTWFLFDGDLSNNSSVGFSFPGLQAIKTLHIEGEFIASAASDSAAIAWSDRFATLMKNATDGLFLLVCRAPPTLDDAISCHAESLSVGYDFLASTYPFGSLFAFLELANDASTALMSAPDSSGFGLWSIGIDAVTSEANITKFFNANPRYSLAPLRVSVLEILDAATGRLLLELISAPQRRLQIMSGVDESINIETTFQWDSCSSLNLAEIHPHIHFLNCEHSGELFLVAVNISGVYATRVTSVLGPVVSAWPTTSGILILRVGAYSGHDGGDLLLLDVGRTNDSNSIAATSVDLASVFAAGGASLSSAVAITGVVGLENFGHAVVFDTGIVVHVTYDPAHAEGVVASVVLKLDSATVSSPVSLNGSAWIAATESLNTTVYSLTIGNSSALTVATPVVSRPNSGVTTPGTLLVINSGSRLVWLSENSILTIVDHGVLANATPLAVGSTSQSYTFCGETESTGEIILYSGYVAVSVNFSTKQTKLIASSPPNVFTSCKFLVGSRGAFVLWNPGFMIITDGSSVSLTSMQEDFLAPGVLGPIRPSMGPPRWVLSTDEPRILQHPTSPRLLITQQSDRNHTVFLEKRITSFPLLCKSDSYCTTSTSCNLDLGVCEPPKSPSQSQASPATQLGCLATPPSAVGFTCESGEWVAAGSVSVSATTSLNNLTIAGTVRIRGNFTIDDSIGERDVSLVLRPGSLLIVEGCVALRGIVSVDLTASILVSRNGSVVILEFESFCPVSNTSSQRKRATPPPQTAVFSDVKPVQTAVTLKPCEKLEASLDYKEKSILVLFYLPEPLNTCEPVAPRLPFDIAAVTGIIWGSLGVFIVSSCIIYYFWTRTRSDEAGDVDADDDLELQNTDAAGAIPMTPRAGDEHYIDLSNVNNALRQRIASLNLIPSADIKLLHEIGSGPYGKVWLGLHNCALVCVKQLKAYNPKLLDSFLAEAVLHQSLPVNPNICQMHGLSVDQATQTYSIVTDYTPCGSIADITESTSEYSDRLAECKYETFKAIYGIARGMETLARANVIHRDLAARNVLLDEKYFPKISGFGGSLAVLSASAASTAAFAGPTRWMSPESFSHAYSEKSDVWSFGCTIIEIVTHEHPFQFFDGDLADLSVAIRDDGLNPLVDLVEWLEDNNVKLPRWVRDALEPCFDHDPEKRPSFSDLVQILQKSSPEYYLQYEAELESFIETPLNVSPAALVATAAALRRGASFKTADISDSLGFGDSSSPSSSEDNNIHRSIARALSKDLTFTPRLPDVTKARILTKLGRGSFGIVYLGKFQGKFVAIKQIQCDSNAAALIKEAGFLLLMKPHRNIISLLGVRNGKDSDGGRQTVELVMEYATRGSLLSYIKRECDPARGGRILETVLYRFALGIARGMQSVAADRVVHRDLAARNVLLNSTMDPLVSDFGFASLIADDRNAEADTRLGSARWMAPEVLAHNRFSEKSDVWSYGVILFEMVTAEFPYAALDTTDVIAKVQAGDFDPLAYYAGKLSDLNPPEFLVRLARKIFERSPGARPSFREIVSWLELNAPLEVRNSEARRLKSQKKREAIQKTADENIV